MVETIAPVVHEGKRSRYFASVGLFAFGALLASGLVGLLAGTLGMLAGAPWNVTGWMVVALAALIYSAREVFGLPIPVPDRHQQVPLWWRSFYSPPVTAVMYGFGLGLGYLTYLSFGTYFVVTIGAFVSGGPLLGVALCAPFGLGRALSILLANKGVAEGRPSGIDRIDDLASTRWPRMTNAATLMLVGAVAVVASL